MTLRKEIYWGSAMNDDRVVEPFFNVGYVYTEGDWGMHDTRIGGQEGGSYVWDAPLKDYADLEQASFPRDDHRPRCDGSGAGPWRRIHWETFSRYD